MVKEPRLPFDLATADGARLIGAVLGDGSLSRRRLFQYASKDREAIGQLVKTAHRVYGDLHPRITQEGGLEYATFGTVTGESLRRAGVPLGSKVVANPTLPSIIRYGDREIKRSYLRQTFDDEGSTIKDGRIRYGRAVDITDALQPEQKDFLEMMEWAERPMPRGRVLKSIILNKEAERRLKNAGIWHMIKDHPPRLLVDEQKLLRDEYGITMVTYPTELYQTKAGYSVSWISRSETKGDALKFKEEIGFGLRRKREELQRRLR